MILDAAVARKPKAQDAQVGVLSEMAWEMWGPEFRGSVAEEGVWLEGCWLPPWACTSSVRHLLFCRRVHYHARLGAAAFA